MMRTLIEKELRENLRWLPVGLALIGSLLWFAAPKTLASNIGVTEANIAFPLLFGAALFALGLGVVQSFSDLRTASRSFLFHRSVSIRSIFYSKLISGAIIYFAAAGIPLLFVAIWFAWKGPDYLPVRPAQVLPASVVALACFGFHPATMLMMARSARWFGTKLLPLFFVIPIIALGLFGISGEKGPAVHALLVGLILLGILLVVTAAKHAWVHTVADEGSFPKKPVSLALKITSSIAAVTFLCISFGVVFAFTDGWLNSIPSKSEANYAIDVDGNLWWAKSKRLQIGQVFESGDRLVKDQIADVRRKLPENVKLHNLSQFSAVSKPSRYFEGDLLWFNQDRSTYFDSRGRVLVYDRTATPPLQDSLSREGKPFAGDPRSWDSKNRDFYETDKPCFWIDPIGVYRVQGVSNQVATILELPIQAKSEETRYESRGAKGELRRQIAILSDGKIHVYRLTDKDGNEWVALPNEDKLFYGIREIAVSPPLPASALNDIRFEFKEDSKFTVVLHGRRPSYLTYNSKSDTAWTSTPFRNPKIDPNANLESFAFSVLPGLFSIVVLISSAFQNLLDGKSLLSIDTIRFVLEDEIGFAILAMIVILLAMIVTRYACHRRMLSRSETISWCCWAVLLGLATPIAVLAIFTRPSCTRCTRCEKQRRIDLRKCEHCGSEWEKPTPTGIEIFDEGLVRERSREAVGQEN